jgi:hypothetical protein
MNPRTFLSSQFFILSFAFSVFFDPVGISYFMFGIVWMFNKKLAYFETLAIFLWKGSYGIVFLSSATVQEFYGTGPLSQIFKEIVPAEIVLAFLYGAILAVQISGKLVRQQIARKAPDLLGIIR